MSVKIRERPKGSGIWWLFIDHGGRRRAKKIGPDKKIAREAAKHISARLTLGDLRVIEESKTVPTFQEYAELWLESYVKPLRRQSTYERYRDVLRRHVFPTLGAAAIDKINRGAIRQLLFSLLAQKFSWSHVELVRSVISGPMAHALDDELIPANPVVGILKKAIEKRDKDKEIDPFTPEEVLLFLETCLRRQGQHYPFFLCAFRTGMRLGELLALQWGDVDWHGKFLLVRRSFKRGVTTGTKTGRQRRVDLSDQLLEALRDLYLARKKEALETGAGDLVSVVFHRGKVSMAQNSIRYIFKRLLLQAGLRDSRFHDIRHTYASLLLTAGVSPVYVKEQLGHSSIQMTVDIYGHLIPGSNREQVNLLDLQPAATQPQPVQIKKA
jgi:integrase